MLIETHHIWDIILLRKYKNKINKICWRARLSVVTSQRVRHQVTSVNIIAVDLKQTFSISTHCSTFWIVSDNGVCVEKKVTSVNIIAVDLKHTFSISTHCSTFWIVSDNGVSVEKKVTSVNIIAVDLKQTFPISTHCSTFWIVCHANICDTSNSCLVFKAFVCSHQIFRFL